MRSSFSVIQTVCSCRILVKLQMSEFVTNDCNFNSILNSRVRTGFICLRQRMLMQLNLNFGCFKKSLKKLLFIYY